MKRKNLWVPCLAFLLLAVLTSCGERPNAGSGSDDDDSADDGAADDDDTGDDDTDDDDTDDDDTLPVTCVDDYLVDSFDTAGDLALLETCEVIDGDLHIVGAESMANLAALSNLSSVTGEMEICHNDALTNLSGLSNLASVAGDLDICHNFALLSVAELSSLSSVGGTLIIEDNPLLCQSTADAVIDACSSCAAITTGNNDDGC